MELLFFLAVGIVILFVKGSIDAARRKQKKYQRIAGQFGTLPLESYSEERFQSISYYYEKKYKSDSSDRFFLDRITWNDLDLDELYRTMNATCSSMGEEYLYAILHEPLFEHEILEERERVIAWMLHHKEERLQLQMTLAEIGKHKKISIYEYMDRISDVRQESNWLHFLGIAGIVSGLLLLPFMVTIGSGLILFTLCYNIVTYFKRKGEIEPYLAAMAYTIRLLNSAEQIARQKHKELDCYSRQILELVNKFHTLKGGASVVTSQNITGDMMSLLLDYVRILFHTDLIRFNLMLKEFLKKRTELTKLFEIVGFLDAMCAVASYRCYMGKVCIPTLSFSSDKELCVEELYHPLVENPVPASFDIRQSVLLTGSNASGKSTFLKAVAINAILAQTIHTALAKQYRANCFQIMTSIALKDNLFEKESYYMVEIKSLKRILDTLAHRRPTLCFVDEVLRGTNTVERIAASSRVLLTLAEGNALCFAATHDIELTYLLEELYLNYHFEEQILNGTVCFDYQLRKGRATSQNAIRLLSMLGYPEELIDAANASARHFLETGEWLAEHTAI